LADTLLAKWKYMKFNETKFEVLFLFKALFICYGQGTDYNQYRDKYINCNTRHQDLL
jgi:hypothetical protein